MKRGDSAGRTDAPGAPHDQADHATDHRRNKDYATTRATPAHRRALRAHPRRAPGCRPCAAPQHGAPGPCRCRHACPRRCENTAALQSRAPRTPGADPLRPHAALAFRFHAWRSRGDGGRPRRDAALRHHHPAVRRLPSEQLRRLRQPGTRVAVRHQRLRRNPARTVRMGRQAPRSKLRDRRARPENPRAPLHRRRAGGSAQLPHPHAGVCAGQRARPLVRQGGREYPGADFPQPGNPPSPRKAVARRRAPQFVSGAGKAGRHARRQTAFHRPAATDLPPARP